MIINFSKMQGLGNDFVVIDAINQQLSLNSEQIRLIADRHFGVGCDQLLLVEKARQTNSDFAYRIFNADGSEVNQCGNGARCFARFVRDKKLSGKDEILVDTGAGELLLVFDKDNQITVNMGVPRHEPEAIPIIADQQSPEYMLQTETIKLTFGAVSMGNPHAVIQVDDITLAPVNELGPLLENNPMFPERVNVGFMQIIDRQTLKLRVYERGAAETLACGSGACAAAVIAIERNLTDNNINVSLPGGQLRISWQGRGQPVFMTGPAVAVFDGSMEIP